MVNNDDNFYKSVGSRLKKLREKKGYSIKKFVEILNAEYYCSIEEKTIRRYEKGDNMPKIDYLIVFSEIFDVSLDYIIFGKETSDDNSFTWKDTFKRINRLIYSCVIIPFRNTKDNCDKEPSFYFLGYDDELNVYMNRVFTFALEKVFSFENRNESAQITINEFDNLIKEFENDKIQLLPTQKRLSYVFEKSGGDYEKYYSDRLENITKKRTDLFLKSDE